MRIPLLTLLTFLLLGTSGCSYLMRSSGSKAYNTGQYNKASLSLKKEFAKEKRKNIKGELAYLLAESYRKQNMASKAASSYSKAIRNGYTSPEIYVSWGQMLIMVGKLPEAEAAFTKALELEAKNNLAQQGLKSIKLIQDNSNQTSYIIEKVKALNSKYSDFGVTFDGDNYDHLYFTSLRTVGKARTKSPISGQGYAHLYETTKNQKGEWEKPEKLDEPLNSPYDEGSVYVTNDGKEMYFTRCILDKDKIVDAQIYKSIKSAGVWGEPAKLELEGDSILFAHPTLANNGTTLYFVSDKLEGKGGKDIWKIEKDGEEWGKPKNLGFPINTPGDEMFPYMRKDGTLYFCSNGLPGYGGLDIFRAIFAKDGEVTVENMGTPLNSSADDFAISFEGDTEKGYFSSARENTKGDDNIYKFILPELEFGLSVTILNSTTLFPIKNSYIKLIGSDGTQLKLSIPADGKLKIGLIKDCEYTMLCAAKGYLYQREKISTSNLTSSKVFEYKVNLQPMNESFLIDYLVFETGKSECEPLQEATTSKILTLLSSNSEMVLEIIGHTDLTTEDNTNSELSLQRAQNIVNQLINKGVNPLQLKAIGKGNSTPLKVSDKLSSSYKFLQKGELINEKSISLLRSTTDKERCNQLLRRIEVKIGSK